MRVSLLTGDGSGTFTPKSLYETTAEILEQSGAAIAVLDWDGDKFQDIVVSFGIKDGSIDGPNGLLKVFLNRGPENDGFYPPVEYPVSYPVQDLTTDDFNGDGLKDIAATTAWYNNIRTAPSARNVLYTGALSNNFATFLPDIAREPTSLATLLVQMQKLQGGNPVSVGPYDMTSQITPSTTSPPDYMAYISLPYHPASGALSIVSPGWFLSATPATLNQQADGSSYTGSGNLITGWSLYDANNNPSAPETLRWLFYGVKPGDPFDGVDLKPIDAQQPIVGLNGGWYYGTFPAKHAGGTWADAFFSWGAGSEGYSPRNLVPKFDVGWGTGTQTGTLHGTSIGFPDDFQYTLTFTPATDSPPKG
jgi:hypothetical protein